MSTNHAMPCNPLEVAQGQLRVIHQHQQSLPLTQDRGVVERMLGHMENMAKYVGSSTADHVNAARRLKDFAATLERIKVRAVDQDLAEKLGGAAGTLRSASVDLADLDHIPSWASSEPPAERAAVVPLHNFILLGR